MPKRQRKSVSSRLLNESGPLFIPTVNDVGRVQTIVEAMESFGGEPYVRIYRDDLNGRKTAVVSLRYTSYRAKIGELHSDVASKLRMTLIWNELRRRAINVPAKIVTDADSPEYLGVWLNAPK